MFNDAKQDVENLLKASGYNVTKITIHPDLRLDRREPGQSPAPTCPGTRVRPSSRRSTSSPSLQSRSRSRSDVPIQDVYTITGVGTVPVGRVETGKMKVGDPVIIMPEGLPAEIKSIETHHTPMQEAFAGDNIGFNLRGVSKTDFHRGSVLGPPSTLRPSPRSSWRRSSSSSTRRPSRRGTRPVLHAHTAQVAATITEIVAKIDPRTGQPTEEKPKTIKTGDSAIVKITPLQAGRPRDVQGIP